MEGLLKELGYTDEQIKAIIDGMKSKKIFTSSEENADIRMSKLQEDFTSKESELAKANELIKQLQTSNKGNEELQAKVAGYEAEIEKLKEEQHSKDIDNALKLELLKNKAKADDIDYLIFKIKASKDNNGSVEIDDNGNLKNFEIEDFKKQYKGNFEEQGYTKVDVKKLGGEDVQGGADNEPSTMLEALKDKYMQKD